MQQLALELAPAPAPSFDSFFAARNTAVLAILREALAGHQPYVYLWGPRGSGKTHLLQAFAIEAGENGQLARYVAAGESIDAENGEHVIAADDAHRLDMVGQLALFDLYNRFRTEGGTLVSAGDRPPGDLPLREDLRTRLGAGLVLRLEPLTDEEKTAAISVHGRRRGLELAPELVDYLLTHVTRDMGTQMAIIDTLDRVSLERKRPITLPLLREVLQLTGTRPG